MGVAAHSPPLCSAYTASAGYSVNPALVKPDAAGNYSAVSHFAGLPDPFNFGASVNGLMSAVYAYSGTQIFLDFMSEMSQPRHFLKSMWSSQAFTYLCYMMYGLYMYDFQGQYVQNPSYLGISPYKWSTVGNSLAMVTALIAAALYGNIGLKGNIPSHHTLEHLLTGLKSSTTVLACKSSMLLHCTPNLESGFGRDSSQPTGLLHTPSVEPFPTFLALLVSCLPFVPCSSRTRSLPCCMLVL